MKVEIIINAPKWKKANLIAYIDAMTNDLDMGNIHTDDNAHIHSYRILRPKSRPKAKKAKHERSK